MPWLAAQTAFSRSFGPIVGTLSLTPGKFTPCRLRTRPLCVIRQTVKSSLASSTMRLTIPSARTTLSPTDSSSTSGS